MKAILGVILMVTGLVVGVYVGGYLMFIGGIMQVIESVRAPELEAAGVAVGAFRFLAAWPVGLIAGFCVFIPGYTILDGS